MENSKAEKVETDRSADIEVEMEPQSLKLVGIVKKGTRDLFRGPNFTEKRRHEGFKFVIVGPLSAHAPKCEENEI